jgi:two-component system response regulator
MNELTPVEMLLAEDNPADAEMTMRALKKRNLVNRLVWVKNGAEALDYIFYRERPMPVGPSATRR